MFTLPQLNYSLDSLEPVIDTKTVEIHYTKHHQGYLDKLNQVVSENEALGKYSATDLLKKLNTLEVGDDVKEKVRNFAGGFLNHNLYWESLSPEKITDDNLLAEINSSFGSVDEFKNVFASQAKTFFGSGWTFLIRDQEAGLQVYSLPNQDSPYTLGHEPVLCLDLWEHAYYLKYQNRRAEYVDSWWQICKSI